LAINEEVDPDVPKEKFLERDREVKKIKGRD
jgi:hypothetical protein